MIEIENVETYGWRAAIRGMRNPMNSWDKSDSMPDEEMMCDFEGGGGCFTPSDSGYHIGPNDMKLMTTLKDAGTDHGKFLRMIGVSLDITAPLYWWKEFDTYKVGTVANSCSTMHKIAAKEFVQDDFSCENLYSDSIICLEDTIHMLNKYRDRFNETKDKADWWQMIQLLPSSYNQRRTVTLNYQVLRNMYAARKAHKLDEWREFCKWVESLPYAELICE